ncbi:Lipid droplet phospholipase 1 [Fulvia fulva]|uniref:Lipid droplet phospholipase 1 n=1 Tax=Passalora fulva TaxID=5499 RepID=A0A9Q8P409_PASFU|nr:Lipid droplet phospholipase 1 [Fulvia fulva]KAK4634710.1 Lipid droplet phospholipase 1 [Fulvia fulva]KAK4637032.1 Lipid droplet phospholipase 1 [Fulvia fulva]UJO12331.1 Lipid droplet phospholipase 1 [Fulvia fulva]WPV08489.1 Lipid droplet phospholipase 1 [Fulvia fulva]WPV24908.1 Lipid droplet phospholipase 1 [Fulvia fulva]
MAAAQQNASADHLAVICHGLWGNPSHLNHLRDTLRAAYSDQSLHILVPTSNSDNQTYDGVEVGGERIANEIEQRLSELEQQGHKIKKISITGYSLGGLVARYAIGLMYSSGLFDRIQPINFTTFATPHIGVRTPRLGARSYFFNFMGARTLSTSGQQLFLIDSFRDTGRPLLSLMADPNSVFTAGLRRFKHKWLYANTMNDRSVPYYTAMFSRTDAYVDLDKVEVHYAKGQPKPGNVILDPENPVTPKQPSGEQLSLVQRLMPHQRTINNIPFYMVIFSLLPLALPVFLANAGYQTYQSAQRIRHHESGKAFSLDRYRVKLLEEAQAVQDRVYERVVEQQAEDYLPTPPPESQSVDSASSHTKEDLELSRRETTREKGPSPLLVLTEGQFDMIENLDNLGFTKYPVHIQKVRHTHAAIVVRIQKESFAEGRVVVQHWIDKFEI